MIKYCIKVRCRKGSDLKNKPFYDVHIYEAIDFSEAIKMMYELIWIRHGCLDPELFEIVRL